MSDDRQEKIVQTLSRTKRGRELVKGLPTPAEERLLARDDLCAEDLATVVEIRSRAIDALFGNH